MLKRIFFVYVMITQTAFISIASANAGVTGRLKGKVIDKETREPLPGVTIKIEGTYFEASTDANGEFYFIAVEAGTYTVSCSSNSYGDHTITETVVFTDQVSHLVFELLPLTADIKKQSTRYHPSDIQSKSPFTISALTRSDISKLTINSIDGIILSSTGSIYSRNARSATTNSLNYYGYYGYSNDEGSAEYKEAAVTGMDNLHVRGGADNELGYYMDGLMLNDPFSGDVFVQLPFQAVDHVSVRTGGFEASYGSFASGIVNITPRRAGDRISFSGQYKTDAVASLFGSNSFGDQVYSFSISGPILTQRLKFFIAADLSSTDDADPSYLGSAQYRLSNGSRNPDPTLQDTAIFGRFKKGPRPFEVNSQSVRNIYANISFDPAPSLLFNATALHSFHKRNIYFTNYLLSPDRVPHQERSTFNVGLSVKWIINTNLFARGGIGYYSTDYQLMERSLFDKGSDAVLLLSARTRGNTNASTFYGDNLLFDINRGFCAYQKTASDQSTGHAALVWQFDKQHFFEAGLNIRKHTIRYASILNVGNPVSGSNNIYGYGIDTSGGRFRLKPIGSSGLDGAKTPIVTGFYVQDRFDFGVLHINGGLRYEIFDPGSKVIKNMSNPSGNDQMLNETDYKEGTASAHWSPRFGVAMEALPGLTMRANYGLYYQVPNYQQFYVSSDFLERMSIAPPYNTVVGNSSLKPAKNESYEVGINYVYQNLFKFNLSRYWKEGSLIPAVIQIVSSPNGLFSSVNVDKNEIDGWDFMMESQMTQNLKMTFHLGIVENMQDYGVTNSGWRAAWLGYSDVHYMTPPRHLKGSNFSTSLNYRLHEREGISLGNIYPFENMSFFLVYKETSGSMYTPTAITRMAVAGIYEPRAIARRNSGQVPNRQNVDVKITKDFIIAQKYQVSTYILITNLLNTKNAANVFTSTGLTNDDAFLGLAGGSMSQREIEQYYINLKDNFNLEPPRQVSMGLTIDF